MHVDEISKAQSLANTVIATLQKFEISATPDNYAVWYEYHSGSSPSLQRTIDTIISNNAGFDERTLHDLYESFLSSDKEEAAVREASFRVLETLQGLIVLADGAHADARHFGATLNGLATEELGRSIGNLKELIEHLVHESHKMAGRSEYVGERMRESADKIVKLEHNLESALLEATMDGLTGVANRKSFDAALRKLAGEAMNSGDDLALLMIDIDHFKRVNDTWGHQVGDVVLRYVAETLQAAVRGEDHVARIGGEEFAVILPRASVDSAVIVGENIRHALTRTPILLDVTTAMDPITVSIGASCYEPGDPLADWVGRTDAALYRAKREGRNCVQFT
jgi:diguanylate cyclase